MLGICQDKISGLRSQDTLNHLEVIVSWYRHIVYEVKDITYAINKLVPIGI